jgi:hypothetical protein
LAVTKLHMVMQCHFKLIALSVTKLHGVMLEGVNEMSSIPLSIGLQYKWSIASLRDSQLLRTPSISRLRCNGTTVVIKSIPEAFPQPKRETYIRKLHEKALQSSALQSWHPSEGYFCHTAKHPTSFSQSCIDSRGHCHQGH